MFIQIWTLKTDPKLYLSLLNQFRNFLLQPCWKGKLTIFCFGMPLLPQCTRGIIGYQVWTTQGPPHFASKFLKNPMFKQYLNYFKFMFKQSWMGIWDAATT